MEEFQSTPPCGGRRRRAGEPESCTGFQSTPPCGGRLEPAQRDDYENKFQSTPPCGGRPSRRVRFPASLWCFNPRPRVGGDGAWRKRLRALDISWHNCGRTGRRVPVNDVGLNDAGVSL